MQHQYVIYYNPSDYPSKYVVREWVIGRVPFAHSRPKAVADTLEEARAAVPLRADTCLGRSDGDDPVIVEVWI